MAAPLPDAIALRIILAMPKGPALVREWTWDEVLHGRSPQWIHEGPPGFLDEAEMEWKDPMLPVTVRGLVKRGFEDVARGLLFPGPSPRD